MPEELATGAKVVEVLNQTRRWPVAKRRDDTRHLRDGRAIFARGALTGASFLVGKPVGLYSMRDVIGAA